MDERERGRIGVVAGTASDEGSGPVSLPAARRMIVERSPRTRTEDVAGVEAVGGIVRMAVRHSSRLAAPAGDTA
jgi:hypothetical protein